MKSHILKKIIAVVLLSFFTCSFINSFLNINVYAAWVGEQHTPSEIIADESLYDTTDDLTISDATEFSKIDSIDFTKFAKLKSIFIVKSFIEDGHVFDSVSPIKTLTIKDCVVNLSTFNVENYESITLISSYVIGDKVVADNIHNSNPLNEEYKYDEDENYGLSEYDKKLNDIAKSIYEDSDGTDKDIIRLVTLYVLNQIDYDHDGEYTALKTYESIFEHNKGVCVHYANLESSLLNKLGIFAIDIGGCVNLDDCANWAHAWDIVYTNNEWFYIDPTWIDTDDAIKALDDNDLESSASLSYWYMIPVDSDSHYTTERIADFTMQNSIPISDRVSKISILDSIINDETKLQVPDTGFFTGSMNGTTIALSVGAVVLGVGAVYIIAYATKRGKNRSRFNR